MSHPIHVGNSLGVRIPKAIITQAGFTEETTFTFKVIEDGLLLHPISHARKGWAQAFKAGRKGRKEPLLMGDEIVNEFDKDEWEW